MSKKILIIDDRPMRPSLHLPKTVIQKLKQLPSVLFVTNTSDVTFDDYDIIAIHKSFAISNNLVDVLDRMILDYSKYVVYFSGGISQQIVSKKGHQATLGSEVFYSSNLLPFCEQLSSEDDIQLYKLIYGIHRWKLPILMRLRQLYWIDPDGDDLDIDDEKQDIIEALDLNNEGVASLNSIIYQYANLI